MKDKSEYIYVVLVKALTGLGKFSRTFCKYEYTHIAVCMNEEMNDFITFSRKRHYSPFDAGFMHETLDCYAFGEKKRVKLKIFRIPVLKKNRITIENYIQKIESDPKYIFNLYSMITMPFLHGLKIYKAHNCMSFVSKIISLSGQVSMDRKYYQYSIKDLDHLLHEYIWKEGYFIKRKTESRNYMNRVSVTENMKLFFRLNSQLLSRMIKKE